jgi:hypothetical protein
METLNLNCDAYADHELERLFQLPEGTSYGLSEVLSQKDILTKQVVAQPHFAPEKRREIIFFLDTIAERLLTKSGGGGGKKAHTTLVSGSHFLIERSDVAIGKKNMFSVDGRLGPDSSAFPPGFMNPIQVRSTVQAICIDSRFRPNYYGTKSTNFQVTLPDIQRKVVSMRVASIELPTTYYAVSLAQGNVTMLIVEGISTIGTTACWVLTLPDGNYEQSWAGNSNAAFIEDAMVAAIGLAEPGTVDLETGQVTLNPLLPALSTVTDLSFTVNHASGKSVFGIPPGSTTSRFMTSGFQLWFNVDTEGSLNNDVIVQLRLGWQLGFRYAKYVVPPPNGLAGGKAVSEGICLVVGPRYAFVSIDDYQKNTGPSYMVAYTNSILQDNLITRINLAELQADTGVYQSSSDPGLSTQLNRTREYFGPVDLQRLHIALYDEYGRVIDLNNMDWSLTLAFEVQYN